MSGSEDPRALRQLLALRKLVDDAIEEGMLARQNLADLIDSLLPRVVANTGVKGAFIQSYDEDLELRVFRFPAGLQVSAWDEMLEATSEEGRVAFTAAREGDLVVATPLDVAGHWFGRAGFVAEEGADAGQLHALLEMFCEELDNFLYSIRDAREKHRLMMELADALRHRVLSEGLKSAVAALCRAMPLDRMLLVYVAQEDSAATLHVQLFERGLLVVDTFGAEGDEDGETLRELGRAYLFGESTALLERFGFSSAREELLISGVTHSVRVGKVVATSRSGQFNTYARELLAGFSGFIRQRVVDFNKEWRRLAFSFRSQDVARLLLSDDYERRFLAPREAEVAIAYVDIAGFTRISEQILRSPSAVAALVESWSREAVELAFHHGGVFDKMVGDCIITLFGPPFYDQDPGERLAAALRWAVDVRRMTAEFPQRAGFEALRDEGLAVTTGVHLAPLFVGTFGPNANFTGFSSGMNNTARLQGTAPRDEILVMEEAIGRLPAGHGFRFGEERSASVKNVAHPLRFRALLEG